MSVCPSHKIQLDPLHDGEEVGAWRAGGDTVSDWSFHPCASFVPPPLATSTEGGEVGVGEGSAAAAMGCVPRGASVSGHRHFRSPADEDEGEGEGEGEGGRGAGVGGNAPAEEGGPTNALRIWDYSCSVIPVG